MQRFYGIVVPKLLVLATRKSLPNAPATFIIAVLIGKLAIPSKFIGCRFHWIPQAIVIVTVVMAWLPAASSICFSRR